MVPAAGLPLELIPPVPLPADPTPDLAPGAGPAARVRGRGRSGAARRLTADVVLGFGGYVSTPAYLAARRLKLPIVVHEQNVLPGLANKLAARFTDHVYTSFAETELPHATWIGLPMRRAITELDRDAERAAAADRVRAGARPAGAAGQRRIAGCGPDQRGGARVLGTTCSRPASRCCTCSGRRTIGDRDGVHPPGNGRGLPAVGLRRADGAGVRGRGPDARPVRGQHGAGDRGGRVCRRCSCPTRTATASSAATPGLVVDAGGGQLLADADCTPDWVAEPDPEPDRGPAGRLAGMSAALRWRCPGRRGDRTLARETLEVAG